MDMRKRVQLNDDEIRLIMGFVSSYYKARLKAVRRELKALVFPEGSNPEDVQRLKREVYKQKFEGELKGLRKLLKKLNRALTGSYAMRLPP